jgi:hypothetical protein
MVNTIKQYAQRFRKSWRGQKVMQEIVLVGGKMN